MKKNIKTITRTVIPAVGLGTRFLLATKATPKEMLPIVDEPTILYIVEEVLVTNRAFWKRLWSMPCAVQICMMVS